MSLEGLAGPGEEVSADESGRRRSAAQVKDALQGRTGILVFSDLAYGKHTELWDVDRMYQPDMSPALFDSPKVLFWDVMVTADT